jgi:hypothetical protein
MLVLVIVLLMIDHAGVRNGGDRGDRGGDGADGFSSLLCLRAQLPLTSLPSQSPDAGPPAAAYLQRGVLWTNPPAYTVMVMGFAFPIVQNPFHKPSRAILNLYFPEVLVEVVLSEVHSSTAR